MKTRTKILTVLAVVLIAGAWLARDQLRMLAYIPSIPTSQEAGIDFETVVTPRTEDTACLAEDNGGTLAQEMLSLETLTVVVAHGENAMPVDVWESYHPDLPWIKNQNRNTLFDADCLTRSPDAPASCKGDDCAIMQNIGGYQWMDLAVVEAQDCFPAEAAGCSPGDEGVIARQVTRKCHYLIFNDEIHDLVDPAGNRYVMHATETGTPNLNASLPEGWTLERRTLDEPLVVSPVGGGDSCYQNVMRDNLEQGYHQYEFASQNHASIETDAGISTVETSSDFPLNDSDLEVMTTPDGVEFVRTPDRFFENLPDWPYEVQYVEIDGLRQAYYEAGPTDGEVILLIHGEPTWSYLYRKMIPPLADAGYRVIAMDHVGMGRSDKPIDLEYYSYLDHVGRMEKFISALKLDGITAFVQDWGSIIGLNVIGNNTALFDRVVMGNGTLPELEGWVPHEVPNRLNPIIANKVYQHHNGPEQQILERDENGNLLVESSTDGFGYWIAYALKDERLRASDIAENGTYFDLADEEEMAYGAPFPAPITMGAIRTLPSFINDVPETTGTAWEGLRSFENPFLTIIGNNDATNLGSVENQQMFIEQVPGAAGQPHTRLIEAGHFLQDDQGPEIARRMLEFLEANPVD